MESPEAAAPVAWSRLIDSLSRPAAGIELAVLAVCLGVAWLVARALRGNPRVANKPHSVWFGHGVVDGALFPALAFALAVVARRVLAAVLPGDEEGAVFRLVMPVLFSLFVIRVTARALRAAFPDSGPVRLIERTVSWVAWIAVVLWVTGVLPDLMAQLDAVRWKMGSAEISARDVLQGAISAGVVMVLSLWASTAIEQRLLAGATDPTARKIAANAVRALLLFVGLILALSAAGIDLTAFGVFGGAIGVGIGLGLQKLAANYVSGFVMLAERSVRIGDFVKVDGFEGRVADINVRYTVIRALNGREAIVPNDTMVTSRVENASRPDHSVALACGVQVAYGTDLKALFPKIAAVVAAVPGVQAVAGRMPGTALKSFGADGLDLSIGFWVDDAALGGSVTSDVNLAILALFEAEGVEIPFPQRVVHQADSGQSTA